MASYTLEQKAETVAEYLLTGSRRHARLFSGADPKTVRGWLKASDSPCSPDEQEMVDRAREIVVAKRAGLEAAYQRAVELQHRDLPNAGFRDRSGFLKIAGEQMALAKGQPTSIVGRSDMDSEIRNLLEQMKENDAKVAADGDSD